MKVRGLGVKRTMSILVERSDNCERDGAGQGVEYPGHWMERAEAGRAFEATRMFSRRVIGPPRGAFSVKSIS